MAAALPVHDPFGRDPPAVRLSLLDRALPASHGRVYFHQPVPTPQVRAYAHAHAPRGASVPHDALRAPPLQVHPSHLGWGRYVGALRPGRCVLLLGRALPLLAIRSVLHAVWWGLAHRPPDGELKVPRAVAHAAPHRRG